MEIRSILVNFDVGTFSPALMSAASDLAARFDAELVCFAGGEPSAALLGGNGGVAAAEAYEHERAAIEASLQVIEEQFKAGMPGGIRTQWRGMIVHPNRGLDGLARCADLVVVDASLAHVSSPGRVDTGDLALKLGRPLLLAGGRKVKAERVVVGWKDTREARRAVSDALPFLKAATDVFVVVVEERSYEAEWTSLKDVLHWLELHGVKARGEILPASGSAAETIMSTASKIDADLVVTGAYGHSRLREWLFGGATEELLAANAISRLISN
jgi:nucleotide-binding universal stress UspA family protein